MSLRSMIRMIRYPARGRRASRGRHTTLQARYSAPRAGEAAPYSSRPGPSVQPARAPKLSGKTRDATGSFDWAVSRVSEIAPLGMERVQLTDNFGRVIREEWIEFGDPLPPWAVEERRRIRAEKRARRAYGNPWNAPMRRGEGWHKRGYRDAFNNMTVNVAFSPAYAGSHTVYITEDATAQYITRQAITAQTGGDVPNWVNCVCFHKKRELPINSKRTAADFRIESAETIYLKCYDRYGNQLRWDSHQPCKPNYYIDEDGFETLDEAFGELGPRAVFSAQDVPAHIARDAGVTKGVVADWFAWRRATTGAGDAGEGDPGRVARAEAAQNRAAHAARAAEEALEARQSRELLIEGEIVEIAPGDDDDAPWCALRPRRGRPFDVYPPRGSHPVPGHGLLDTGNLARTMINPQTAAAAGIVSRRDDPSEVINGVNGSQRYPTAMVHIRIRGAEHHVRAAIGGTVGVLVGEDVLGQMFEEGWSIAGFYGVAAGPRRVQWVRHAAPGMY